MPRCDFGVCQREVAPGSDIASGEVVIRQEVGAEKELHSLLDHFRRDPMVDLAKLFTGLFIVFLVHCCGRLKTFGSRDFVGRILSGWCKANLM